MLFSASRLVAIYSFVFITKKLLQKRLLNAKLASKLLWPDRSGQASFDKPFLCVIEEGLGCV
jgi:hypothetical protein